MKVIPKQIEMDAILVDYDNEFLLEVGEKLDKKFYHLKKDPQHMGKRLFLKMNREEVPAERNNYIIVKDRKLIAYISEELYRELYIQIADNEQGNSEEQLYNGSCTTTISCPGLTMY